MKTIKLAILQSQYNAAKSVNEKQLQLYYGIGKYISVNSRNGFWGTRAVDAISEKLQKKMPGLRGFSSRNLRNMRMFYEEWSKYSNKQVITPLNLAVATAKIEDNEIWQLQIPNSNTFLTESFLTVGFTRNWYIQRSVYA